MMNIVVGLGNSGKKYEGIRHNIGFLVLEALKAKTQNSKLKTQNGNLKFKTSKKFKSEVLQINDVVLVKPRTMMNRSGVAVQKLTQFYKVRNLADLYVVHDDLDIPLGKFKIQKGKGPKVHGGVLSFERELGRKDFWRVRVGIENRCRQIKISGERYVMGKFMEKEKEAVKKVVEEVAEELKKRWLM